MNAYLLCYIAMMELMDPGASAAWQAKVKAGIPPRFQTCVDVVQEARKQKLKVPIQVVVATGFEESRFHRTAVSSAGAIGPLQVLPRFFCPQRKAKGCDTIKAGIVALRKYFNKYKKPKKALCHYCSGNTCRRGGQKYANRIMARSRRYEREYKQLSKQFWENSFCVDRKTGDRLWNVIAAGNEISCEPITMEELQWQTKNPSTLPASHSTN